MEKSSQELSIPAELLGLSDIKIDGVSISSDNEIMIRVSSTQEEIPCHRCGELTNYHGKGRTLRLGSVLQTVRYGATCFFIGLSNL